MNKVYPTKEITSAWLTDRMFGGIKNIIGIVVEYDNQKLFYSILDDCFFLATTLDFFKDYSLDENWMNYSNQLFAQIYSSLSQTIGIELFENTQKYFFTKEELIANKSLISGYYSDLDYELNLNTNVDYENYLTINENIIRSEVDYREKKQRPIIYDTMSVYGPKIRKLLKT